MLCCDAYTKVPRIFHGYSLAFSSFLLTAQLHCNEHLNLLYTKLCKNFLPRLVSRQFLHVNASEGSYWGKQLHTAGIWGAPPAEAAGVDSQEPWGCSAQPWAFPGGLWPRLSRASWCVPAQWWIDPGRWCIWYSHEAIWPTMAGLN